MLKVWRRLPMRQKYKKMFQTTCFLSLIFSSLLSHVFHQCSWALAMNVHTSGMVQIREKFWKFQILIKFKFKFNIIFSEKIWKNQEISENFRFSEKIWKKHLKKSENFRFSENMKNSEKIWKFQIFRKKIWKSDFQKRSEKFRKNLKISDFQKKMKNSEKKFQMFRKKIWQIQKKIGKFQILRKNLKKSKKTENFRFSEKKNWKFQKKNKISEKI